MRQWPRQPAMFDLFDWIEERVNAVLDWLDRKKGAMSP